VEEHSTLRPSVRYGGGGDARGPRAFDGLRLSVLDFKLGGRMLVKHPALTGIAMIAVAFAIAVGTVGFEIARQAL
jgi:hypothetical protein